VLKVSMVLLVKLYFSYGFLVAMPRCCAFGVGVVGGNCCICLVSTLSYLPTCVAVSLLKLNASTNQF
jgi:hypothetical protein